MGRPSKPLIHREAATAAALEIVDREGVEALSLRKLGSAIGVHGMSLYYHFADKQAILDEVAKLILSELRVTKAPPGDFVEWSLANAKRYRRALLAHPNAIPIFVDRYPKESRVRMYDSEFAALKTEGIDQKYWMIFLETIEAFVVGSVLYLRRPTQPGEESDAEQPVPGPKSDKEYEAGFELAYRALVSELLELYRGMSAQTQTDGGARRRRRPSGEAGKS